MPRPAPYGFARTHIALTVPFTGFLSVTTQANLILSKLLGYAATLERIEIVTTVVGTGASASRLINIRKGSATGAIIGTVTATLANQGALGVATVGAVVSAANANFLNDQGAAPDALTIEFPASGTAFSAGGFDLILTFRQQLQKAA